MMPNDINYTPPIRVVTTVAVTRELMEMASLHIQKRRLGDNVVPCIGPITVDRLGRFFVVATMLLGAADALMLSAIANHMDTDIVYFPGWEILDA